MEKKDKSDAKEEGAEHMGSCCAPKMAKRTQSCCASEMIEKMRSFMESRDSKRKMGACCCDSERFAKDSRESGEDGAAG